MNWSEAIVTYTASSNSDQWSMYLGIATMILGFGGAFLLLRKPVARTQYNRQMLIALLLFFVGLIGMGAAFFSYWSFNRSGEVAIHTEGISVGNEVVAYKDIKTIFIKEDKGTNIFNAQTVERYRFLVIERQTGRPLIIPGEVFPIGEIKTHIGAQIKGKDK